MPETTNGAPYPAPSDPNNIPADLQALAEWADDKLGTQANLNDAVVTALSEDPASDFHASQTAATDAQAVNRTDTADDETGAFDGFMIRTELGPRDTKWTESVGHFRLTEGAETLTNSVKNWGFNVATNATKLNPAELMFRIGMESSYLNPDGVWSELHLGSFLNVGSSTEIRPISIAVVHDGDGGVGSPRMSFQISEDESPAFLIWNVAQHQILEYGSGRFHSHRSFIFDAEEADGTPSGATYLQVGWGKTDAELILHRDTGKSATIRTKKENGDSLWTFSDFTGETPDWAMYDNVHSRMHATYAGGANAGSALTQFHSALHADFRLLVGTGALATNAADGFFNFQSCAGTPTGSPVEFAGRVPMVYDSVNKKICIYDHATDAWLETAALS